MKPIIFGVMLLGLGLAGCATTSNDVVVRRSTVVTPPTALYNCPTVTKYPDPKTLTDVQVAKLLNEMDGNNRACRKSMNAVKAYIQKAKSVVR